MKIVGFVIGVFTLMYFIVAIKKNSHDKRFNKIVKLSADHNKTITGAEFNIEPLIYKDELFKNRYNNYEVKDDV